ncbi:class F sortase, partial [Cellulomonas sp. IC4_254]|uniref:class F sortase n=1 Tax=Cellulomonas sp. IC4_254 TaxID=2714040 RepID=UPI001424651B
VAAPTRLTVPDLGVAVDVVPVGTDDVGALEVPADPRVAGWWSSGAVPGAPEGSTVVAAHVDAEGVGAGPMAAVLRAAVGTRVEVTTTAGTVVRYAVAEVRSYPKSSGLPAGLFAVGGPSRLVVITCSGAFRSGHYADNAVVVATPL